MARHLARPQLPDDLDGLLEHLGADLPLRPGLAEDVLVEVLAGPDTEEEPPGIRPAAVAAAWAMIAGWIRIVGQVTPVPTTSLSVACGDGPEDAPHERAVRVPLDPRMEVVRDERELEAGLLGGAGVADESRGPCSSLDSA